MTTPTSEFRPPPPTRIAPTSVVKITTVVPDDLPVFPSPSASPTSSLQPATTTTPTPTAMGNTSDCVPSSSRTFRPLASRIPSNPALSPTAFQQPCPVVPSFPTICTSHFTSPSIPPLPSPMARSRRSVSQSPPMHILSSPHKHTLVVQLPATIQPDMVTISVNKGDRLKVVADAWHMETDCHYEWQISFPPRDVDMSSIHAKFDPDGHLTIDVHRRPDHSSSQG